MIFLICISSVSQLIVPVFANNTASDRQSSFLNFMGGSDEALLSTKNLTSQDYYVLATFMSNWYEPGKTTLKDLVEPSSSETFYSTFESAMGKSNNQALKDVISDLGMDIFNGINSGACLLVDANNTAITGVGFLEKVKDAIKVSSYDSNMMGSIQSSVVYFGNKNNIAFDFGSSAIKAAFQTLAAYNPDLFLTQEGLSSANYLFLDSIGNVWATKSVKDGYDFNNEYNKGGYFDNSSLDSIYLVLPACLNPSTFTPNAQTQDELRMPLMNRFVLGSLLNTDDLSISENGELQPPTFTTELVPFYNLLAKSSDRVKNRVLNIFGVNSLSPLLMNTQDIYTNNWNNTKRNQDFANFVYYNHNGIAIQKDVVNGVGKFNTNSYIVFSSNMSAIKHSNSIQVNSQTGNYLIDLKEWFGISKAFDVFNSDLNKQKQLFLYLYSPTILHLNQVSMSFYALDSSPSNSDDLSVRYSSILTESENKAISKMGARGFSLFLDTMYESEDEDGSPYLYSTPQNQYNSVLVNNLMLEEGYGDLNLYDKIKNGGSLDNSTEQKINLNYLFQKYDDYITSPVQPVQGLSNELPFTVDKDKTKYNIIPLGMGNVGNDYVDIVLGNTLGLADTAIRQVLQEGTTTSLIENYDTIKSKYILNIDNFVLPDFLMGVYGYSIFTPSQTFLSLINGNYTIPNDLSLLGTAATNNKSSTMQLANITSNNSFMSGIYFGYIIDMVGITSCTESELHVGKFSSKFLPKYNISSSGGDMSYLNTDEGSTGVINTDEDSLKQMQEDLIRRIYGITNNDNNDYRNGLIKNILDGFFLTVHRTVVGTWNTHVDSVIAGDGATYQSVMGYIYTPRLEELSFTSSILSNYITIYIICMIIVLIVTSFMVIISMKTIREGLLVFVLMSVFMLTPYILISNTINISNKVADSIYSDRFDFWAICGHQRSLNALSSSSATSDLDEWLIRTSAISEGNSNSTDGSSSVGVRVKWMSPKKVDLFQSLYSEKSLSESFVTNMEIFKWLFNSFVYDSEFVETDNNSTYLYRSYNNIALEAESYYQWGKSLMTTTEYKYMDNITIDGVNYSNIPTGYSNTLKAFSTSDRVNENAFISGLVRMNKFALQNGVFLLNYSDEKLEDLQKISQLGNESAIESDKIGLWGSMSAVVSDQIAFGDDLDIVSPGIMSNLPSLSISGDAFINRDCDSISRAIYLKNTESPYYYFYSVLKDRYGSGMANSFKDSILNQGMYKVISEKDNPIQLNTNRNVNNTYRDFLDLEGLFEYVIPYLKAGNDYVHNWQEVNGTEIDDYNFNYEVDEDGYAITDNSDYHDYINFKNAQNRVWNMYCPWVDSLYDLDVLNNRLKIGGSTVIIEDTLNPSSYLEVGRSMIYSEADMVVKGYNYTNLTDVEKRIQAVLKNTYDDIVFLANYYDMDDETLLSAAAMYATFNFNREFSKTSFLGKSVMLYPQGFELRNFNYDAYMRLAILNATGENIFASTDLYTRILQKGSIFTGLLLVISDVLACILIPLSKYIIVLGLFFIGILMGIICVVSPQDKMFKVLYKTMVFPTFCFLLLNIGFAFLTSCVVGEGLTAYVGSKSINIATNDPTITICLMIVLESIYFILSFKIIKTLLLNFKEYGIIAGMSIAGIFSAVANAGVNKVRMGLTNVGSNLGIDSTSGFSSSSSSNVVKKFHNSSGVNQGTGSYSAVRSSKMNKSSQDFQRMVSSIESSRKSIGTTDRLNNLASSYKSPKDTIEKNSENKVSNESDISSNKATSKKKAQRNNEFDKYKLGSNFRTYSDENANNIGKTGIKINNLAYKFFDNFDASTIKREQKKFEKEYNSSYKKYKRMQSPSVSEKVTSYIESSINSINEANTHNQAELDKRKQERRKLNNLMYEEKKPIIDAIRKDTISPKASSFKEHKKSMELGKNRTSTFL